MAEGKVRKVLSIDSSLTSVPDIVSPRVQAIPGVASELLTPRRARGQIRQQWGRGLTIKQVKEYYLLEELGKGAFGKVFRGYNPHKGFTAIKQIIKSKIPKDQYPSLIREIELLQQLQHPNLMGFVDYHETRTELYLILEYIEGGSLRKVMRCFGCFSELLLSKYTKDTLAGLDYLHSASIIHRDIKGENILLCKDGSCKLCDFGSCIGSLEDNRDIIGTPFWMAPEVIQGYGASEGGDIWSLGCTLLELYTGNPPYWSTGPDVALFLMVEKPSPPLPKKLSPEFEDFFNKCFAREAEHRPSASELLGHPWLQIFGSYKPNISIERGRSSTVAAASTEGYVSGKSFGSRIKKGITYSRSPSSLTNQSSGSSSSIPHGYLSNPQNNGVYQDDIDEDENFQWDGTPLPYFVVQKKLEEKLQKQAELKDVLLLEVSEMTGKMSKLTDEKKDVSNLINEVKIWTNTLLDLKKTVTNLCRIKSDSLTSKASRRHIEEARHLITDITLKPQENQFLYQAEKMIEWIVPGVRCLVSPEALRTNSGPSSTGTIQSKWHEGVVSSLVPSGKFKIVIIRTGKEFEVSAGNLRPTESRFRF